jgi:hypothetical protein
MFTKKQQEQDNKTNEHSTAKNIIQTASHDNTKFYHTPHNAANIRKSLSNTSGGILGKYATSKMFTKKQNDIAK